VFIFFAIFFLLFHLANFLHESQKINNEIDQIRAQNAEAKEELQEKKQQLEYLETPQRVDKEAKMQMSKKLPGEDVLVFVDDRDFRERALGAAQLALPQPLSRTPLQQWVWLFFDRFEES
jgi:cell division protein FtsL